MQYTSMRKCEKNLRGRGERRRDGERQTGRQIDRQTDDKLAEKIQRE